MRAAPVREAVTGWIDEMLREDLAAPGKQRHTARRIFERLVDEHDAQVSYSTVAKYVHRRRAEIVTEQAGRGGRGGRVRAAGQDPGAEAEVDFADVFVELAGRLARCYLFDFRLSCSGKGCHRVYASSAQEAFLEGHVTAFEAVGGVPWRQIRYDNLSPAVAKVLRGRSRAETARWLAFRSWYKSVPAGSHGRTARGCCWQRADLGSSGHRYRFEHSWYFFVIPEIPSAISGAFPDS